MSQDEHAHHLLHRGAPTAQSPWSNRQRAGGRSLPTTLLVGHPRGIGALHEQLRRHPLRDYRVIGCCLSTHGQVGETFKGLPVLGGPDDVLAVVCRYDVDTVAVLPWPGWDAAALSRLGSELEAAGADLLLGPATDSPAATNLPISRPLRRGTGSGPHGVRALVKSAFDRAVAVFLLLLLAPVLIGVAVGVKATCRGPVLVRSERVGRNGHPFSLLRFRTTEVGPGAAGASMWEDRAGAPGPEAGDTPFGSLLRRFCIDELPQLLNVLRGEMSLVGPRPGPPSTEPRERLSVRPGLIGLAQVSADLGRWRVDRVCSDVDYAQNWSLLLDLVILGRTFSAALRGGGGR